MYKISDTEFKQFLNMARLCKHCHGAQHVVRSDDNGIYIHCHNCKYDTRSYATLGEALQEWNYEDNKDPFNWEDSFF